MNTGKSWITSVYTVLKSSYGLYCIKILDKLHDDRRPPFKCNSPRFNKFDCSDRVLESRNMIETNHRNSGI